MSNEIKENDVVERISPTGTHCIARVRWVNDKGEAGVTYIAPEAWEGSAQVVALDELKVMREGIGEDLKHATKAELITAITRLRGMRLPKKPEAHRASTRKPSMKSKLNALFAKSGSEFDDLIDKTIKKIREEEKGG